MTEHSAVGSLSDRDLMRRIAGRAEDALSDLYDRFAPTLFALAVRILHDPADAEEVLQETFVHVWDRASSYDVGRSSVSTWLVLITRSRAIDRLRSRRVAERTVAAAQLENPAEHRSPEGARDVFIGERRARVIEALAHLPREQHQVIALAFYRGLTQREIAETVGIPLGTVKTRTLLAMKKLRAALRDEIRELL